MCNAYEQHVRWVEYSKMMQDLELGIPTQQSELDLPQSDLVRINDMAPVMRAAGNGIELAQMNFSFPPGYVGTKYPKTQYRFTLNGAPFLAIAGLWREAEGNLPASFTMLTTSPGQDIASYHDRQVVVLKPEDWAAWLYLTKPEAELLKPLREGSLEVEMVREGRD
jgi:putative SOS response-associated peptidase YedK